jgi:hypothetical protein
MMKKQWWNDDWQAEIPGASNKACPDDTVDFRSHSKTLEFIPVVRGKKLMTPFVN